LYYSQLLKYLLYLMVNYYLITAFVVLLTDDKTQPGARHLPNQGAAPLRKGQLAHQRSRGLGHDMRVVGVRGVQSHLKEESAQPIEQGVGAPLWGGRSHPQDPEAGMIFFLSFRKFFALTFL
jgi:hypothetical protein